MTVVFQTAAGELSTAGTVFSARAEWTVESPAASFAAVVDGAVSGQAAVRWRDGDGQALFEGYVDTLTVKADGAGRRTAVTGRSAGAFLLDNEALPAHYSLLTLGEFFRRTIAPYGLFTLGVEAAGSFSYTVPKGVSEWEALSGACHAACGRRPWLTPEREIRLRPGAGSPVTLPQAAVVGFSTAEDRSAPLSRVLIRDGNGYYTAGAEDRAAVELGIRRKRYWIPPTRYEDGRDSPEELLLAGMAAYRTAGVELAGLWPAYRLWDRLRWEGRDWVVAGVRLSAGGDGCRTRLTLRDAAYADAL